jgi:hypothetical protein
MPGPFVIFSIVLVSRAFTFARRRQWEMMVLALIGAAVSVGIVALWGAWSGGHA